MSGDPFYPPFTPSDPKLSGIVLNGRYGGFSLNDWILDQLKTRGKNFSSYDASYEQRMDIDLLTLIENHPEKIKSFSTHLYIQEFEKKYINYIRIDEYDGLESLEINYDKYSLDQEKLAKEALEKKEINFIMFLNKTLFSDISSEKKVDALQMLFREGDDIRTLRISELAERAETLPGFGEEFEKAKTRFEAAGAGSE